MPFGHEQRESEKRREIALYDKLLENKIFLEVTAMMLTNGNIIPTFFEWEGRKIKIQKVLSIQEGGSLKDGFIGKRYLCQAMNKRFYLYFSSNRWYIDF